MITRFTIKNLTVFDDVDLRCASGLNVIIAENGLGKTHLLKAMYCALHTVSRRDKRDAPEHPTKAYLQTALASKLRAVFMPDELGRLARRQAGRNRCEIACSFRKETLSLSFHTASKTEVSIDTHPKSWLDKLPVYLPTRELLSIYPGFVSLYELHHLSIDETWRDTCVLLGGPLARGPRETAVRKILNPLEEAMGGSIELDGDKFYLKLKSQPGRIEMHLLAEGLRKLAMVARLVANGSLFDKGALFWDEPEANLNPKLIKLVARVIMALCQHGIQVFIATHSLFLLRELHILKQSDAKDVKTAYFGIHAGDDRAEVTQGEQIDDIPDIVSLDEDLAQSDRYMNVEYRQDDA
jgi:energy-coupling factor transporter ATP-binding protein EcfA2